MVNSTLKNAQTPNNTNTINASATKGNKQIVKQQFQRRINIRPLLQQYAIETGQGNNKAALSNNISEFVEIPVKYKLLKIIGEGGYGVVMYVKNLHNVYI